MRWFVLTIQWVERGPGVWQLGESGGKGAVLARAVRGPLQKAADDALHGLAQMRSAMEATASYVLPRDAVDSPEALDE